MSRPRLLDLFCGAGGAAMGYHRAGFDVVGVDIRKQTRYPFAFVQADALEYLRECDPCFDAIHASPPCQGYSALKHLARKEHPMLIEPVREALRATGKPYIIENVVGAPLLAPLLLCGSMFGLQTNCGAQLRRHRLFESNLLVMSPGACRHTQRTLGVNGHEFRDERGRWQERRTINVVGKVSDSRRVIGVYGTHPHDPALYRAQQRKIKRATITVTGNTPQQNVERNTIRETFSIEEARRAMGIEWMTMAELSQAIPPAYTQWIGRQLREVIA